MENNNSTAKTPAKLHGCGIILLLVFFSLWVIGLSAIDLFVSWTIEQSLFESSVGINDFRWIVHAIYSFLVLIPCIIFFGVVKTRRIKMIFRLWLIAAILAIFTIPMKTLYLTAQNETAILQSSSMLLLLVSLYVFKKKPDPALKLKIDKSHLIGLASIVGWGLAAPWINWGAFGSVLDTLLELIVGVIFALLVVNVIFPYYLEETQRLEKNIRISDFILDGFVVAVFLLILITALAHNGSQQMLVITVPVSGWLISAFAMAGIGKKGHGKAAAGFIAGLVIALPLIFFDMDELSLVISSGAGEALTWANKAAWVTFMSLLMLTIVLLINFRIITNLNMPRKWNHGLVLASILGSVLVYIFWGQIGFFGEKLFVILKSQTDLSIQAGVADYSTRRSAVYNALVKNANTTQTELWAKLDRLKLNYTPYYLLNAIEVNGGAIAKLMISNDPSVDRILDSPQLRPLPKTTTLEPGDISAAPTEPLWNLSMINSDKVNEELKVTGKGIVIGQTDSGVDGRHPELGDTYRGKTITDDYNWYDPWNHSTFPTDGSGHGTQTLGVILGKTTGIAPDAQWIGCVNLARNLGNPAKYLDCMQFMLAPFPQDGDPFIDGDPAKGAMIVNNSWGCPIVEGCDPTVFESTVKALMTAGIFMSSAAGNTGYYGCATLTDPLAIYEDVFTAGSINQNGELSTFSSLGPVLVDGSNRNKPDLLAPGEKILSAYPGGTYTEGSGTSFSAPHVSGVVALMWSANSKLIGNIEETTNILLGSVRPYQGSAPSCGDMIDGIGAGILDAYKAVQYAISYK